MNPEIRHLSCDVPPGTQLENAKLSEARKGFSWLWRWPKLTLLLLTLACLIPFSGKAVHIDDPLFLWAAKQIVAHPLNPYGFSVVWYRTRMPMSEVTQNPPLASYYAALTGFLAGWSERALHLGFLLPAVGAVLGTYRLARRLSHKAWLAATATLVAPGFLISATGLMCDVMMLALWIWAMVFWVEGLEERPTHTYLALSSLLISACALTKYFGISLVPLLLMYSTIRRRRVESWIVYLVFPFFILAGYELWTRDLYGHGLIWSAAHYRTPLNELETRAGRALVGLAFTGGCTLPALTFASLLWSRRQIIVGGAFSAPLATSFFFGWINTGQTYIQYKWVTDHQLAITMQLLFYVAGGISLLALAVADVWKNRDAESSMLLFWVAGTVFFAIVLNWTVNARSLLPMIPAVSILIARRLDKVQLANHRWELMVLAIPLTISGAVSLWVAASDMALANTARSAASYIREKTRSDSSAVWFEGHWGFQYYMELAGARPLEDRVTIKFGDLTVVPEYNTSLFVFPLKTTAEQSVGFDIHSWVIAMNPDAGAGFYFSGWGPVPFVFGPVPNQLYVMARVVGPRR